MTTQLDKVVPRLTKHARFDESYNNGIVREHRQAQDIAAATSNEDVVEYHAAGPMCEIFGASDITEDHIVDSLSDHDTRYDYFGPAVRRTAVRFGWEALTIAELRDLNRHRTGTKTFHLAPVGSYFADDQVEILERVDAEAASKLRNIREDGEALSRAARTHLEMGSSAWMYYLPIGAQCKYEHVTTADKFLYQCELRTGLGAHYTYATRMREVLELWHQKYPRTRTMVRPGTAEPE